MLMNIKCSAVTSIKVALTYDNEFEKEAIIGVGDLIDVVYNANGLRKRACGKVLLVSANGVDPKSWYFIVDGSDDFDSNKARISPMSILELEVIAKGDNVSAVRTLNGDMAVPYLRIVRGRLQWSKDGCTWYPINVDRVDILDQEGTTLMPNGSILPQDPHLGVRPEFERPGRVQIDENNPPDGIQDAVW